MKILLWDGTTIKCWKIEPSLKAGKLVIDEDYSILIEDIVCIMEDK